MRKGITERMKGKGDVGRWRKLLLSITVISGIIVLFEIVISKFFSDLTLINGTLIVVSRIISYIAFSVLIFGIALLLKAKKIITILLGLLLLLILFFNAYSEIYPIDTTTKPHDILILKTLDNGNKIVVREYKNSKTNRRIQDTVWVNDIYIFRQIIERSN